MDKICLLLNNELILEKALYNFHLTKYEAYMIILDIMHNTVIVYKIQKAIYSIVQLA